MTDSQAEKHPAGASNPEEASQVQEQDAAHEQNGQYIEESSGYERVVVPHRRHSGEVESQDLDSIRAKNVNMNQSGAENIDAETVTLSNGGAKSIKATTVDMKNSGGVSVAGDTVTMNQSSAVMLTAQTVEAHQSGLGVVFVDTVKSDGDVSAFLGFIGNVEAGGKVHVALDAKSALALGAGFAVVLKLFGRLIRR